MKHKLSFLKLNVLVLLIIWCGTGILGVLFSFNIEGSLLYLISFSSIGVSSYFLFGRYRPATHGGILLNDCILTGSMAVYGTDIIETFEINTFEKILFTIKSPENDYSTCFLCKGLLLKTCNGSFLIDDTEASFLKGKKSRQVKNSGLFLLLFYLLLTSLPAGVFVSRYFNMDPLVFSASMFVAIYIGALRFLPPFYLGKKLQAASLPLSPEEVLRFKGITIIKGFALSDRLSVIPLKKPLLLEGLAIDILFKKYIILNSRLFYLGSEDYLRFVLFHELCHIKHRDSSRIFLFAILLMITDMAISLLPQKIFVSIREHLPFYEYLLMLIAILYMIFAVKNRKSIEKRADRYGIQAIGEDGVSKVREKIGVNLRI